MMKTLRYLHRTGRISFEEDDSLLDEFVLMTSKMWLNLGYLVNMFSGGLRLRGSRSSLAT